MDKYRKSVVWIKVAKNFGEVTYTLSIYDVNPYSFGDVFNKRINNHELPV